MGRFPKFRAPRLVAAFRAVPRRALPPTPAARPGHAERACALLVVHVGPSQLLRYPLWLHGALSVGDTPDGKGSVANLPICGPPLILYHALKCRGLACEGSLSRVALAVGNFLFVVILLPGVPPAMEHLGGRPYARTMLPDYALRARHCNHKKHHLTP